MDELNEVKETLKDLFRKAINNSNDDNEKGQWITVKGTHVFIPDGANKEEVVEKFLSEKQGNKSETKKETSEKQEDNPDDELVTIVKADPEYIKKQKETNERWQKAIKETAEREGWDKQGSEKGQSINWDDRKDKKQIEKKLTEIAKKRFDTIETLETQHIDNKDFHDLAVWGIKDVLTEAYQEGAGNKNKVPEKILADIAKKEMDIPTLKTRESDSLDFHDVSVWSLKESLKKAYLAGEKNKINNSIQNGLENIIDNCKPETEEDLQILKGLKKILEEE